MGRHSYDGEKITVHYDTRTCIHAAECVKGLPAVFNPENRPWVSPDEAAVSELTEVIARCPTGALTYERKDGGPAEQPAPENTVHVSADGPVFLAGDLRITDSEGTTVHRTRAAICRCGASHVKPFCDNSHQKAEFHDPGVVGDAKTKPAEEGQTALEVRVLADGPVLLSGPHRLVDAKGETQLETGSGYLCRCGASQNKPFCDGKHKEAAFTDSGVLSE